MKLTGENIFAAEVFLKINLQTFLIMKKGREIKMLLKKETALYF